MDYRLLGRTGLRVSPFCLGTMNFGPETDEPTSHAIMDAAHEAGINFFDTANRYGDSETERIIGRWFAQGGGRREKTVIATKVYGGNDPWPNTSRLSALHIRQACEDSLRRLQTDHIDLYQMHHVDRDTSWDEIWQAMELLVQQGKVIYVGTSNFAGWQITQGSEHARRRGALGLVSEQSLYNVSERTIELEVIPACQEYGLGVIPWSPLGGGMLGGAVRKASEGRRAGDRGRERIEQNYDKLVKWEALCDELGQPPADVALAWLLGRPGVTGPIIGPRTIEQLHGNLGALDVTLDQSTLDAIDEIFPGPRGPAPEAYAW
jgi:aryl-alcohol dehydrogenase-like predicted oxidoreductase